MFQRVHIFVKSKKVQNTAHSTKMADGIYVKLHIFNRPEQKEGNWVFLQVPESFVLLVTWD